MEGDAQEPLPAVVATVPNGLEDFLCDIATPLLGLQDREVLSLFLRTPEGTSCVKRFATDRKCPVLFLQYVEMNQGKKTAEPPKQTKTQNNSLSTSPSVIS